MKRKMNINFILPYTLETKNEKIRAEACSKKEIWL